MFKRFSPWAIALACVTAIALLLLGTLKPVGAIAPVDAVPTHAESVPLATAPAPPELVPAILNGQPIHVLYMTRSGDRVLVRCYPGIKPMLTVMEDGQGMLVCPVPQG